MYKELYLYIRSYNVIEGDISLYEEYHRTSASYPTQWPALENLYIHIYIYTLVYKYIGPKRPPGQACTARGLQYTDAGSIHKVSKITLGPEL